MNPIIMFLYRYLLIPQISYIIEKDGTLSPGVIKRLKLKDAIIKEKVVIWSDGASSNDINIFLKKYLVKK